MQFHDWLTNLILSGMRWTVFKCACLWYVCNVQYNSETAAKLAQRVTSEVSSSPSTTSTSSVTSPPSVQLNGPVITLSYVHCFATAILVYSLIIREI